MFYVVLNGYSAPAYANNYVNLNSYKAKKLFERITGVKARLSDPQVKQMALLLDQKKDSEAAQIATNDARFVNGRARNFALSLSTKNGSFNIPMNDTAALIVGVMRDNIDFREVLTGSYHYDLTTSSVAGNLYSKSLTNSYTETDSKWLDLNSELIKVDEVVVPKNYNLALYNATNARTDLTAQQKKDLINKDVIQMLDHPDPAGILTTRYFSSVQLSGGTNRRAVEYVVTAFLCSNLSEIGNSKASDAFVGKDVDRFPGGNPTNYVQNCKSCHTVLDSWRGAFAKVDYSTLYSDLQGSEGMAHGKYFRENDADRKAWLAQYFEESHLYPEIDEKKSNSVLHKAFIDSVANDPMISLDPLAYGDTLNYTQALERTRFRYSSMLLAMSLLDQHKLDYYKTYTGTKTAIDTAVKNGSLAGSDATVVAFRNWIYTNLNKAWSKAQKDLYYAIIVSAKTYATEASTRAQRSRRFQLGAPTNTRVYSFYNADATMKAAMTIDNTKALSATNIKANWKASILAAQYVTGSGDYIVKDSIAELNKIKQTELNDIFNKKTDPAIIALYSETCLNAAPSGTSPNKNFTNFLNCDLDLRTDKSILGSYLISKVIANGSSAEVKSAMTDLVKRKGLSLSSGAFNEARDYMYSHLNTTNNRRYFNAKDFDADTEVHYKMNKGNQIGGFTTKSDEFTNLTSASYGWRGPNAGGGRGLKDFGRMISESETFSKCMTKKTIESLCHITLPIQDKDIRYWATRFESSGYKMKTLISDIAVSPLCGILDRGVGE